MHRKSIMLAILVALLIVIGYGVTAAVTHLPPFAERQTPQTNGADSRNETTKGPSQSEEIDNEPAPVGEIAPYYVAIDDGGVSGEKFGCNDSLVKSIIDVMSTDDAVKTAVDMLITDHNKNIGGSGLYNALYQSDLTFESWSQSGDEITVYLSGELRSGGACDGPRIIMQLERTAATAAGVMNAKILVNGSPIEELLSGR